MKNADDMAIALIEKEEGFSEFIYKDTEGNLTVGVGILLKEGVELPRAALDAMFRDKMARVALQYKKSQLKLCPARQAVIASMIFQMGFEGLNKFVKMFAALRANDYEKAADEMLDSKWAKQTPARAKRAAQIMRTGEI